MITNWRLLDILVALFEMRHDIVLSSLNCRIIIVNLPSTLMCTTRSFALIVSDLEELRNGAVIAVAPEIEQRVEIS